MVVTISVSDFGPIKRASVALKPLTVLVGPNNSGKSILATVTHAALGVVPWYPLFPARTRIRGLPPTPAQYATAHQETIFSDEETDWLPRLLGAKPERLPSGQLPLDVKQTLKKRVVDALEGYAQNFLDELERCFGTKTLEMRRAYDGRMRTRIVLHSTSPEWQLTVLISTRNRTIRWHPLPELSDLIDTYLADLPREIRVQLSHVRPEQALDILAGGLIRTCFRGFPRRSKYLPAARSGLLQSQKVLTGALIRQSSFAGIENIQIPALPGVITDFLGEMVTMSEDGEQVFDSAASELENRILNGTIDVDTAGPSGAPEFRYRTVAANFPLHRTSSMVSEIAPIILYLRHILSRGDLLMVEEPEAHLHPASQIVLAEVLTGLANDGLTVLLTTHSEFFLQQISNLITASQVDDEAALDVGIRPKNAISPDKVGAYIFRTDGDSSGTVVEELEVNPASGLSEASFIDVTEALYNQSIKLDREREATE